MTEVNTYSAAVDEVIVRSGRPDKKADILSYVRSTLRECQTLAYFKNDLTEDTLTSDAQGTYIWQYPQEYRLIRTVRYPYYNARAERIYPPEMLPGKKQREYTQFYYSGPGYVAFAGIETVGDQIDVAYYSHTRKLPYYESGLRPATFSLETNTWSYLNPGTDAENETARNLVSNWLLFNYYDTIIEGGVAKALKAFDDKRSGASFGLYKSYQKTLVASEPSDSLNK